MNLSSFILFLLARNYARDNQFTRLNNFDKYECLISKLSTAGVINLWNTWELKVSKIVSEAIKKQSNYKKLDIILLYCTCNSCSVYFSRNHLIVSGLFLARDIKSKLFHYHPLCGYYILLKTFTRAQIFYQI